MPLWGTQCSDIELFIESYDGFIREKYTEEYQLRIFNTTLLARDGVFSPHSYTAYLTVNPRGLQNNVSLVSNSTGTWIRFHQLQYSDFAKRMVGGQSYSFEMAIQFDDCEYTTIKNLHVFPDPPRIVSPDKIYLHEGEEDTVLRFSMNPTATRIANGQSVSCLTNCHIFKGYTTQGQELVVQEGYRVIYDAQPATMDLIVTTTTSMELSKTIAVYVIPLNTTDLDIIFWMDDVIRVQEHGTRIEFRLNRDIWTATLTIDLCEGEIQCHTVAGHTLQCESFIYGQDGNVTVSAKDFDGKMATKKFRIHVENVLDEPVWREWRLESLREMEITGFSANSIIPTPTAISLDNIPILYYFSVRPTIHTKLFHMDATTGQLKCTAELPREEYVLTLLAETFPSSKELFIAIYPSDDEAENVTPTEAADPTTVANPAASEGTKDTNAIHLLWLLIPLVPLCSVTSYVCFLHLAFSIPVPHTLRECKTLYIDGGWRKQTAENGDADWETHGTDTAAIALYCHYDWIDPDRCTLNSYSTADSYDDESTVSDISLRECKTTPYIDGDGRKETTTHKTDTAAMTLYCPYDWIDPDRRTLNSYSTADSYDDDSTADSYDDESTVSDI